MKDDEAMEDDDFVLTDGLSTTVGETDVNQRERGPSSFRRRMTNKKKKRINKKKINERTRTTRRLQRRRVHTN